MSCSLPSSKKRFRNIHIVDIVRYRLPVPGLVSILHRVSGAFLFLAIPLMLWLLEKVLSRPMVFAEVTRCFKNPFIKIFEVILFWSFVHHIFAGLRFIALDFHWGVTKSVARLTGSLVLGSAVVLTVILSIWLFL